MMPKLRNEDRLAVDLLLDRAVASSGGNGEHGRTGFTQVNHAVPEQVGRIGAVLKMLELMSVEEPPADLLARTLRRVDDESARHDPSALRPPQQMVPQMQMPHA